MPKSRLTLLLGAAVVFVAATSAGAYIASRGSLTQSLATLRQHIPRTKIDQPTRTIAVPTTNPTTHPQAPQRGQQLARFTFAGIDLTRLTMSFVQQMAATSSGFVNYQSGPRATPLFYGIIKTVGSSSVVVEQGGKDQEVLIRSPLAIYFNNKGAFTVYGSEDLTTMLQSFPHQGAGSPVVLFDFIKQFNGDMAKGIVVYQ